MLRLGLGRRTAATAVAMLRPAAAYMYPPAPRCWATAVRCSVAAQRGRRYAGAAGGKGMMEGMLVLELANVLAGPSVCQFMAELGAEVIKVENSSTRGDVTRTWKLAAETGT
jgi:hypothetical protein